MVGRLFAGAGSIAVAILKAIMWLVINVLYLILELVKVFLLLLGLVGRIFFAFGKAGTV